MYTERQYAALNGLNILLGLIAATIAGIWLAIVSFQAGNEPMGLAYIGGIVLAASPARCRSPGAAGAVRSPGAVESGACGPVFCADATGMGAGPLHPVSWGGAVARLALALRRDGLCVGKAFAHGA